jgi:AcrR family transcriptional regulator
MLNKRQAIVDTATRLFYAHGYHAVGIDRIIAEAGVAKMTMYKHFASKTDLICAVLKERDFRFQESLFSFANSFYEPLEKLKAVFTWHDRWLNESTFNGCMFISAAAEYSDPSDEIHQISKLHKKVIQDYLISILKEIAEEKVALKLGAQTLQILEGAIVTGLIFSDRNAAITAWSTAATVLKAEGLISADTPQVV